jgi:hypothetical protein
VAVLATGGEARVGARVSVEATPQLLAPLEAHRGRLFTGSDGWLRQGGDACALFAHDESFVERGSVAWAASARCDLTQSTVGRVEGVSLSDRAIVSVAFPGIEPIGERAPGTISGAAIVHEPAGGTLYAVETTGGIAIARPPDRIFVDGADSVSVAPDRLRGGTLVLYRRSDRRFALAHIGWDGALELVPRADLDGLEPVGPLVSNETEALVPLRDGSMLFVPLSHFERRFTEPVEEGGVDAMEIVLRPGESAGGLLYTHRLPSGESALVFRPLTCNR